MKSQRNPRSIPRLLALCAGLLACACGSTEPRRASQAEPGPPPAGEAHAAPVPAGDATIQAPPPWAGASSILSNGGSYRIHYKTSTAPPPRGDLFAMDVWVLAADHADRGPLRDVNLTVDAAMPEHEHGMNRIPISTALGDGHFRIEGLLFHMSGLWQIYFDVTRASVTERAQVDVVLE